MVRCKNCIHNNVCKYINKKVSIGITVFETLHNCKDYMLAADVAEVKHGKWETLTGGLFGIKCNLCKTKIYTTRKGDVLRYINGYKYCPNCGAKMDGTPQKEG